MRTTIVFALALCAGCHCNDPDPQVSDTETTETTTTTTDPVTGTAVGDPIVSLTLTEPAGVERIKLQLRSGVPFPEGLLDVDTPLGLSVDGELVPAQSRVLSVWDDGTARWILFDAILNVDPSDVVQIDVVELTEALDVPDPLDVTVTAQSITVSTGPLRVEVPVENGGVLSQIWMNDVPMLQEAAPTGPYVRSQGQLYEAANLLAGSTPLPGDAVADADPSKTLVEPWPLSVTVEEQGPIHAVVRISGSHLDDSGMGFSTFITRLHLSRGSSELRVDHTLVYTGADGDGIDGYGFRIPLEGSDSVIEGQGSESVRHLEADEHLVDGGAQAGHALGTVARDSGGNHAVVVLRDMAELSPKGLSAGADGVNVELYPEEAGTWTLERYSDTIDGGNGETGGTDNRGAQGLARTDTFVLQFGEGNHDSDGVADLATGIDGGPVLALAEASWISDAKVMGVGPFDFPTDPASPGHYRTDRFLTVIADFMRVNQRSEYGWYGLEDYGDIRGLFSGSRNGSHSWSEVGRYGWSGNSGEPSNQLWLQYLRRPSQAVLLDAEALARHTFDQQMIHYGDANRIDDTAWNGRNRESAVGSLHRHGRQAWSGYGGQPEYSHVSGVETWYYLSGDLRARETLFEAASFIEQYGPDRPDWTALVNGIDVLSRAEAVFWDTPHGQVFADRNDVLIEEVDTEDLVGELLDNNGGLPFELFVRGTPGLIYHHERTGDSRAEAAILVAADRMADQADPYGLRAAGENGAEFFHLLPVAYAAEIAADPTRYRDLSARILALNCHVEASADANAVSDASLAAIPDDWTDWTFAWEEDPITPGSPGILWIDRQITYMNDFVQDYHSYRTLIHLAAIAGAVPPGANTCAL